MENEKPEGFEDWFTARIIQNDRALANIHLLKYPYMNKSCFYYREIRTLRPRRSVCGAWPCLRRDQRQQKRRPGTDRGQSLTHPPHGRILELKQESQVIQIKSQFLHGFESIILKYFVSLI